MPGAHVGERAVLGSMTLGAKDSYFPPDSVHTGNVDGKAMLLRFNTPGSSAGGGGAKEDMTEEKRFELLALNRVDNPFYWWSFNAGLCLAALIFAPAVQGMVYVALFWGITLVSAFDQASLVTIALMLPVLMLALDLCVILLECVLKWLFIGKFTERNYAFMGWFHFRWMVLMMLNRSDSVDKLPGTVFYNWFYRACGAKVGRNVCNFGFTLEYDMFEAGDYVCIGSDVDHTCHTVEHMVLKISTVKIRDYASVCAKGVVMPGGEMLRGALLLEDSQV
jgi:hypothetical protein